MKITIETRKTEEADLMLHASDWVSAMWNLDNWLRGKIKHGHDFSDVEEALDAVRTRLHDEMENAGIAWPE